MTVEVSRTDTISAQVPVPATMPDTRAFLGTLHDALMNGYILKSASTIEGGTQRDPYVVGLRVTMEKLPTSSRIPAETSASRGG